MNEMLYMQNIILYSLTFTGGGSSGPPPVEVLVYQPPPWVMSTPAPSIGEVLEGPKEEITLPERVNLGNTGCTHSY